MVRAWVVGRRLHDPGSLHRQRGDTPARPKLKKYDPKGRGAHKCVPPFGSQIQFAQDLPEFVSLVKLYGLGFGFVGQG